LDRGPHGRNFLESVRIPPPAPLFAFRPVCVDCDSIQVISLTARSSKLPDIYKL